jgi:hypothetical protein
MKLESSVGQKLVAKNKREDVLTTQKLLNGLVIDKAGYKGMPAIFGRAESFFTRDGIPPMGLLGETGTIDDKTVAAIVWFQKNVVKSKSPDGVIGPSGPTWRALIQPNLKSQMSQLIINLVTLPWVGAGVKLQEQDFADTAADLGVGVPEVKAVQSVESSGSGYIDDGRPP